MTILPIGCAAPMPDRSAADRPFDRRDLRTMMGAAAYHARRVARSMMLGETDREDVEQDILLVLVERRRYFDPARGPWPPFAHRIARQAAQVIADGIAADRAFYGVAPDPRTYGGTAVNGEPATAAVSATDHRAFSETDILDMLSLIVFVGELPVELRIIAEAAMIADGDLAEAQRALRLSTSEFYRRLREIRYRMFTVCLVDRRSLLDP